MGEVKLTKAQRRALEFLADRGMEGARSSEIGCAMDDGSYRRGLGLTSQGAGRLGGSMGSRLVRLGLAVNVSSLYRGFPAYAVTPAGRAALTQPEAPDHG